MPPEPPPPATPYLVPKFLFGRDRDVKSRSRRIASAILKAGSWATPLAGETYVDIDADPKGIIMRGPYMVEEDADDATILLYPMGDAFFRLAVRNGYERCGEVAELLLAGMDAFWMSLVAIGSPCGLLPQPKDPAEARGFAIRALGKVVRWWPGLVRLEERYMDNAWMPQTWPLWGNQLFIWCREAGMPAGDSDRLAWNPPADVGQQIDGWLKSTGTREGAAGESRPPSP